RSETFFVRGQRPLREVMYDTRHGTLLAQPDNASLGLALNLPQFKGDRSLDALFDLTRARNVERAFDSTREVTAAALNFV
ncbi:penicillin acylase family protein, partial [Pseudomonas sp. SIMBA_068]